MNDEIYSITVYEYKYSGYKCDVCMELKKSLLISTYFYAWKQVPLAKLIRFVHFDVVVICESM